MRKYIDTGKIRIVKIKKTEFYCDNCGKRLGKDNPKITWTGGGKTKDGCKNDKKCNPFHPDIY